MLLTDRHINTENVGVFLVDDGVNRNCRLPGLAITDDQFTLSSTNRHHRVDGLDPRCERFVHGLSANDARGLDLEQSTLLGFDGPLSIDRVPKSIHHSSDQCIAHRNIDDASGSANNLTLADAMALAHHRDADVVFFEVEHHAR